MTIVQTKFSIKKKCENKNVENHLFTNDMIYKSIDHQVYIEG